MSQQEGAASASEADLADTQAQPPKLSTQLDFTVGWICATPYELEAVHALLDQRHPGLETQAKYDRNSYTLGTIGPHNVAIAYLTDYSTNNAGTTAESMQSTFPNLIFGLMVGIGSGMPSKKNDLRLGDVVVSRPSGQGSGMIQYNLCGAEVEGFRLLGKLNKPPFRLRVAIIDLQATPSLERDLTAIVNEAFRDVDKVGEEWTYPKLAKDNLFRADFLHIDKNASCESCVRVAGDAVVSRSLRETTDSRIHYGNVGSGNSVMKMAAQRNLLAERDNIICFET